MTRCAGCQRRVWGDLFGDLCVECRDAKACEPNPEPRRLFGGQDTRGKRPWNAMTVNPEKAAQRREAEAELAATEPEPERIKEEPATGFIVEMETGQWIEWINPADGSTETTSDRKSARVFHSATTRATFEWLGYRAEAP